MRAGGLRKGIAASSRYADECHQFSSSAEALGQVRDGGCDEPTRIRGKGEVSWAEASRYAVECPPSGVGVTRLGQI